MRTVRCAVVAVLIGLGGGAFGFAQEPCSGGTCPPGKKCTCVRDPCARVQCEIGTICSEGRCVTDPCADVLCRIGTVCVKGACVRQ